MNINIFDQVKFLNLPLGKYAVIGSGVMAAHGIRDYKDIDLLVSPDLYDELRHKGWKEKAVRPDFVVIEKGIFEAGPNIMTLPTYEPDINELIDKADIINGVAFVRLTDVIDFKRAMARPKDLEDIGMVEKYLNNKNA